MCARQGTEAGMIFSLKCLMNERPYLVIFAAFMYVSVVFGFAVRTVERTYYEDEDFSEIRRGDDSYQDYTFFANGWWLIVVTMSTVGFGDYFAKTYLGRTISVLACFFGVFMVSITIAALDNSAKLRPLQKKAYNAVLSYKNFASLKQKAAKYIWSRYKLLKHDKKI